MARAKRSKRKYPDETIKATQAQMLLRINQICKMMVMGANRGDILEYAIEKWSVAESTIDVYIARAREQLKKLVEPEREDLRKIAFERLNTIFYKASKVMDYQRAIAAQHQINQLAGLYAPLKVKTEDWRDKAIEDIKAGRIDYLTLAKAFDDNLALQLFAAAGKPVMVIPNDDSA